MDILHTFRRAQQKEAFQSETFQEKISWEQPTQNELPSDLSAVTDDPMMGTTVVIEHDGGYQTTYANLQDTPTVVSGDEVSAGQIIGAVGTTASAESAQSPHLHFSVSKNGTLMDPDEFLNQ